MMEKNDRLFLIFIPEFLKLMKDKVINVRIQLVQGIVRILSGY